MIQGLALRGVAEDPGVLVIACSATKRPDAGWMPACVRYDGPLWRTYRTHGPYPRTFALSALFGLIEADSPIPDYDVQLGRDVAPAALGWLVALQLSRRAALGPVAFTGGRAYASLLEAAGLRVQRLSAGGIGDQRHALGVWLASRSAEAT